MNNHYAIKPHVEQHFRAAGLEHFALLDARAAFDAGHSRWRRHLEAYLGWLRAGRSATMGYLARGAALRADPSQLLPGLSASFVFLIPYSARAAVPADEATVNPKDPKSGILNLVARYARSRDYHKVIKRKLNQVFATFSETGFQFRVITDSVPFLDRAHAQMAGLGFTGRNTMLIRPGLGSYFFIASVLTDAEPERFGWQAKPSAAFDRLQGWGCETCDLCVKACPTGALSGHYQMDASLCLSYLSIERHGPSPDSMVQAFGQSFFGCDICQDVCPYNLRPRPATLWSEFAGPPPQALAQVTLRDVASMTPRDCEAWFGGLPLMRAKYAGLVRNALYALLARRDAVGLSDALALWQHRLAQLPLNPAYAPVADIVSQVGRLAQDLRLSAGR